MSAALRSSVTKQRSLPRRSVSYRQESKIAEFAPPIRSRHSKQQIVPLQPKSMPVGVNRQTVKSLPNAQADPAWLKLLMVAHRGSSLVTVSLIAAVLAVYSWTVYSQQIWSRQFQQLEALQRKERQLTTANEVFKNEMAQQAGQSDTGLLLPSPGNTIFLEPATPRPPLASPSEQLVPDAAPTGPLGY
ncbi:hypothetical protein IQ268_17650 [Oculatella sp. LEGE 06141]|uniref:cytochrome c oxidase assembly protein COX14 n=1 Tax=Oculatella sp. LEGE 06141 TaxID=1828648 RepID=UPI0018801155|nr:cytochrome c oxidase assembly protein COX14 [Oculatella sp. LEGE 06141]MBE9180389.1 hypothetical protein [Oculatella sp. LEGE 06141]